MLRFGAFDRLPYPHVGVAQCRGSVFPVVGCGDGGALVEFGEPPMRACRVGQNALRMPSSVLRLSMSMSSSVPMVAAIHEPWETTNRVVGVGSWAWVRT